MTLRPYQQALSDEMDRHFAEGAGGVVGVLATGGGKTRVFSHRILRLLETTRLAEGESVGVICHRTELIGQTVETLNALGVKSVGAIAAKLPHLAAPRAKVQVASLQTLMARGIRLNLRKVVLDECHHLADDSRWGDFAATYGHVPREGYTATPARGDGKGLRGVFDAMAVGPGIAELTALGFLVPFEVYSPIIHLGSRVAQDPVDLWRAKGCKGKRTIVYAGTIARGVELEQRFAAEGVRAAFIDQSTPTNGPRGTDRIFADFRAGRVTVLVNVYRLTEGTDLPPTEVVCLGACAEDITYLQCSGRGARISPATGKDRCILLDPHGATRKHKPPWVPRRYSLDGRGMTPADTDVWQCPHCGGYPLTGKPPRGEPCPLCGECPPVEERGRAAPQVTGHDVVKVTPQGDEAPAPAAAVAPVDFRRYAAMRRNVEPDSQQALARQFTARLEAMRARSRRV